MIDAPLSHYRLEAQIGAGGMGVVYRAYDTKLQRRVAIKLLHSAPDQAGRSQLLQEARAASVLNHRNICIIHEVEDVGERAFIVMEYADGSPLTELLPRNGLPVETVVRYGIQIADALAHAHQRGVIHRDLKSSNVVITSEGLPKVLDFGLARRLRQEELDEVTHSRASTVALSASNRSLIDTGQRGGTLPYMAPELLRGEVADERSDLWSFGVLLYEMAVGTLPFMGKTGFELSAAILREPATPLPSALPAGLRLVILRCLAKEAGQRYQRAGEVRAALETVQRELESPPVVPSRLHLVARSVRRGLTRKTILAAAAALVAIVALASLPSGLVTPVLPDKSVEPLPATRPLVGPSSSPLMRAAVPAGQQAVAVFPFRAIRSEADVGYIAGGLTDALATREAIPALLRVVELAPDSDKAYRELGRACAAIGWNQEALQWLRKAIEINQTRLGALQRPWRNGYQSGPIPGGCRSLPQGDRARAREGQQCRSGVPADESVRRSSRLKLQPHASTYTNLGVTYANTGRFAQAVRMFEKAVELGPAEARLVNLADGYRWLGQRERASNLYDSAIALSYKKLRVNPRDAEATAGLALAYAKKGNASQAMQFIAKARNIKPDDVNFVYYEAIIHLLGGNASAALQRLRDAFRAGYPAAFAQRDPDLRVLRPDPDFQALMTEFTQTAGDNELRQRLRKWMEDRGMGVTGREQRD